MLYHLLGPLEDRIAGFGLFQYVTFRAAFAAMLAFLVSTVVGPGIVQSLRRRKIAGFVAVGDATVDAERQAKASVPTMGGVILLVGVGVSGFLFARLDVVVTWVVLLAFLAFGALGMVDDWRKLTHRGGTGLSERQKLAGQVLIALAALGTLYAVGCREGNVPWLRGPSLKPNPYATRWIQRHEVLPSESWNGLAATYLGREGRARELALKNGVDGAGLDDAWLALAPSSVAPDDPRLAWLPPPGREIQIPAPWSDPAETHRHDLQIPLVKGFCLDLGLLFLPFGFLVIVGASNAVNLTDGLDGLAIGATLTTTIALGVVAFVVSRTDFAQALYLFHVPEGGEVAVLLAALGGGALGFLWFNAYPASVFMGDTGSLGIGGFLGVAAVALRHEVTLLIAGGLFVGEALSVMWQRAWFKGTRRAARRRGEVDPTGKRWFRCAPIHHHFQKGGWHENKVVVRFWIVSVICAVAALVSLKVR
ncbi:MAG: phospho-N-acetylmuramoyl-pentapeptide-transferase [Planctomycetota bacterium]